MEQDLQPDFAIYGSLGDRVNGQAYDFTVTTPTAPTVFDQMRQTIQEQRGTPGLIPVLEASRIAEAKKNNHYRSSARAINFSFIPLVMEATGGMSKTLRALLREWTLERSALGITYDTKNLVKEVSFTLLRGQTKMLNERLTRVYAIQVGFAQRGSHVRGGYHQRNNSNNTPLSPRRQQHQRNNFNTIPLSPRRQQH